MKKWLAIPALGLALATSACNTPGERAAGGALLGGAGGAAIGAAAGGGRGALIGGLAGAAVGGVVGANTAPAPGYGGGDPYGCPYGSYVYRGQVYCR